MPSPQLFFGGTELQDAPTLAHSLWEALKKVGGSVGRWVGVSGVWVGVGWVGGWV